MLINSIKKRSQSIWINLPIIVAVLTNTFYNIAAAEDKEIKKSNPSTILSKNEKDKKTSLSSHKDNVNSEKIYKNEKQTNEFKLEKSNSELYRLEILKDSSPITHSVTKHQDWNVACEQKNNQKSCFTSTFVSFDRVIMKLKIGVATSNKGLPDLESYVLSIETMVPPDRDSGYSIVTPHAQNIIPVSDSCKLEICKTTVQIQKNGWPLLPENNGKGLSILATMGDKPHVWKFSLNGLSNAFEQMRKDMTPVGPNAEEIRLKKELQDVKIKEELKNKEKVTGVNENWELNSKSLVADEGRKIRIISLSKESSEKTEIQNLTELNSVEKKIDKPVIIEKKIKVTKKYRDKRQRVKKITKKNSRAKSQDIPFVPQ